MIAFLEEAGEPQMGEHLLKVSPAQADILLKPERKALEIKGNWEGRNELPVTALWE